MIEIIGLEKNLYWNGFWVNIEKMRIELEIKKLTEEYIEELNELTNNEEIFLHYVNHNKVLHIARSKRSNIDLIIITTEKKE